MPFFGDDEDGAPEEIETSEQRVYGMAQRALRSSNYTLAIDQLERLEATGTARALSLLREMGRGREY